MLIWLKFISSDIFERKVWESDSWIISHLLSCPEFLLLPCFHSKDIWLKVCVYTGVREGAVCSKVMVGIWVDFATDLLDRFLIVGESHHLIHTCASIQKSPPSIPGCLIIFPSILSHFPFIALLRLTWQREPAVKLVTHLSRSTASGLDINYHFIDEEIEVLEGCVHS